VTLAPARLAELVEVACLLEVSAPKPGNVSPGHDFDDMTCTDFIWSALAVRPAFERCLEHTVGRVVREAIAATRARVRFNTNLGIVLLLAPLARAAAQAGGTLHERTEHVLHGLDLQDTRDVFAAIRLAAPGHLGDAPAEDVRKEPALPLREVMALAADRDAVAREYASNYDRTFETVVPALQTARRAGLDWPAAALEAHLTTLAQVPDTLIARKVGMEAAREASRRAAEVAGLPWGTNERARGLQALDAYLRSRGHRLNPGTTADLVAAGLFVALVEEEGKGD
jgi:triphosphoribosyl-dephospho-CoA synthase